MKKEIKVPAMGESITEATIGEILKTNGSQVKVDEEILELETDKVNQVLYASENGVLELLVKSDDVVQIGQVIGTIDTAGASPVEEEKEEALSPPPAPLPKPKEKGSSSRISKEDYLAEVMLEERQAPKEEPAVVVAEKPRERRERMSKIRQVIASRLVEAQQTAAMLTTFNEVDLSEVVALRKRHQESFQKEHGVKLGFMSLFVKAAVAALKKYPLVNAQIDGNEIVFKEYYDIGIAVSTDRGLIVPVLKACDQLTIPQIEKGIMEYATEARKGTISIENLQGGTFTITNGGIFGSMLSTPILNAPQSAILGMHNIVKRAVVIDDQIVIRPMMYLALSYDHRIIDGKEAVSFLVAIKQCLEDPAKLLLEG
ncbi:MAG: dihydrolipoyllysine-residue succinyltransferase [Chlamydiia bacterium]|nr:dihydrolipoyllysine-residue succinyltransferase [Chlamydiia bacterium]